MNLKSRELSKKLKIEHQKFKRWSREFLGHDPHAGMQSGYAREYTLNDAFMVFLGGHLVSALKYSIPESKTILEDIWGWISSIGLIPVPKSGMKLEYPYDLGMGLEWGGWNITIRYPGAYTAKCIISFNVEYDKGSTWLTNAKEIRRDWTVDHSGKSIEELNTEYSHPLVAERTLTIQFVLYDFIETVDLPSMKFLKEIEHPYYPWLWSKDYENERQKNKSK